MNLKIIDNWYETPDEVRKLALTNFKSNFQGGSDRKNGDFPGFYPGFRTKTTIENSVLNLKKFQTHLNNRINESKWIYNCSVDLSDLSLLEFDFSSASLKLREHDIQANMIGASSNCSFQYIPENCKTWIHSDKNNEYAAVIYLHPNPIKGTGTSFYKRKKTEKIYSNINTLLKTGTELEIEYESLTAEEALDESCWEQVNYVENVYNRCIIYEGKYFHTAKKFFGSTLEDSRLTQVFFFDLVDSNIDFEK